MSNWTDNINKTIKGKVKLDILSFILYLLHSVVASLS